MRRTILLFLAFLFASGTVAGSLAHATEDQAEASLFVTSIEADCVAVPATEDAEANEKKTSPTDKQQIPAACHCCHGHHSGVPAETLTASAELPRTQSHAQMLSAALPPAAFPGTFRPPIA
jgi:cytochrome c553